jgi:putative membrane protein
VAAESAMSELRRRSPGLFIRGFAMGTADVIPGVSGGTLALITGIYDELVRTIAGIDSGLVRLLLCRRWAALWTHLNAGFLVPLLCGIGAAIVSFSRAIHFLLDHHPVPLGGFLTGLILASALVVSRRLQGDNMQAVNLSGLGLLIVGAAAGYGVTLLWPLESGTQWYKFLLSGSIASVAMILPGISGSFLLVIMGKYDQVIGAVNDFDLGILIFFGSGFAAGILAFSRVLKFLLARYKAPTMTLLVGLMAGSVRRVWPFKRYQDTDGQATASVTETYDCILPNNFDGEVIGAFVLMLIGFAGVLLLERLGRQDGR